MEHFPRHHFSIVAKKIQFFLQKEGRCGLVGLFVMYRPHGAKVRWFETRLFFFLLFRKKDRKTTKGSRQEENELNRAGAGRAGAAEEEGEGPAGESGEVTRKAQEGSS